MQDRLILDCVGGIVASILLHIDILHSVFSWLKWIYLEFILFPGMKTTTTMLSVGSGTDWSQDVDFRFQAQMEFCSSFHVYCNHLWARRISCTWSVAFYGGLCRDQRGPRVARSFTLESVKLCVAGIGISRKKQRNSDIQYNVNETFCWVRYASDKG